MERKILVTGANGQLGSEFRAITHLYPDTFIFTDIDTLDLTNKIDTNAFLENQAPDVIINCAAYTAVDKAQEEKELARELNVKLPKLLASYGNKTGCSIIHLSTEYVFGGNCNCKPLQTIDEAIPLSIYGETKLEGEHEISLCNSAMIIRTSWLYSKYGNNFVRTMTRLMKEREELSIVYDQLGTPTHAKDLAAAIMTIIDNNRQSFVPGIYHYTNEGVASWYDFAWEIREHTGAHCRLIPVETKDYPLPAKRPAYAVLSKEKIKKQFGLAIPYWKESLKNYFNEINS
jgi:dTDP-4-dehydrorhamnose reductase